MTTPLLSCPKQASCPGCPLGSAPYEDGLRGKGQAFGEALRPYRVLQPELLPPRAAAPSLAYRLRAKLVSHGQDLGLFERGSHRVIDLAECRVLSPSLLRAGDALRRLLPLPLHGADLRETSEGVLVTLLTEKPQARAALTDAARRLVTDGAALSVAVALRRPGSVRLLAGAPEVVAGPTEARHALRAGAPYAYAAHGGFVQAHAAQASYVYAEIARGLQHRLGSLAGAKVLELFAGNGSLALTLAQAGASVTAVEAYAPAIELATRAANEQRLHLDAVASDATRFMQRATGRFDAILVNPPRRGLDPELRESIGQAAPRALAYVSCNPQTLARDAAHLALLGLRLESAEPLDMIPWSDAIEALTWFGPARPPAPDILYEDENCFAVEKAPHELVFAPRGGPSLSERVRSVRGHDDAVALDGWGRAVSGVCWFAKDAATAVAFREAGLVTEHELTLLTRGELRKQGTITRHTAGKPSPGSRYRKQAEVGRHSLVSVITRDANESETLRDFARIRHAVLGDQAQGDDPSNQFVLHRHGLDRAFVHSQRSELRVGADRPARRASCELSPDLRSVLRSLGSD